MELIKIIFGIFIAPLAALVLVFYGLMEWECGAYQSATGKATKVAAMTCYVQDGGQWFAWEEYKYRMVAKGAPLH